MKLLIDECLPRALKRLFGDHTCRTVQEMGWAGKKNGLLLSLAETEFDVLITMDQGYSPAWYPARKRRSGGKTLGSRARREFGTK